MSTVATEIMLPLIQPFSSGYELIELQLVPGDCDVPRIQETLHDALATRGSSREPVVLRDPGKNMHFTAHPDPGVPTNEVELPDDIYDSMDRFLPSESESLLLAKPQFASHLLWLAQAGEIPLKTAPSSPL